jgi:AraC-like DNA-binding protein
MPRVEAASRRLLRARDAMDRSYARPLDVPALARVALTSEAHFIRTFKQTFGETPHRYLQRRRMERAMALLRETDRPVTEICLEVGFASLGTFSRTFKRVLGMSPTAYRAAWRAGAGTAGYVPTCVVMAWMRPATHRDAERSFGEAGSPRGT